jgi:DNA-binding transcriptional regulator YiaG
LSPHRLARANVSPPINLQRSDGSIERSSLRRLDLLGCRHARWEKANSAYYAILAYSLSMATNDKFTAEYMRIVDELVRRRKAAGMTQKDIARRLKTAQSQISKFERSERRLDIVDFVRICRAIGIAPGAILDTLPSPLPAARALRQARRPQKPRRQLT